MTDREPSPLPAEMVRDAAEGTMRYVTGTDETDWPEMRPVHELYAYMALLAAGVPALLARIEELTERYERTESVLYAEEKDLHAAQSRIRELEAALAHCIDSWPGSVSIASFDRYRSLLGDR